ncbi:ABC transporter ATP-binding protein [Bailinhaonella thermotolerans]|uniref:ABC transporter ATP-binding protein n=1 Tax=Bailinhaonella thermotolerans TaxID=1070861 RepID=A0A3A4ACC9_9ACTN|nr:ABC transporter ATP-binding protein [Bailinhaonella thermotolerans]RJL24447.1 ABC transporter ATP-binding protein [Bailinhaonella thermotolerans]
MDDPVAAGAAVRLSGLRKSFGEVRAVRGVELTVAPGEVLALLGPNAAGKTTTMEMLLGLTTPDAGEVTVFGRTPRRATAEGLVGAMLQSGGFLGEMTAREIVGVMAAQYPGSLRVADALARAGVEKYAKARYGGLSGGQKQRVRFAAALVCDPDLLVLDEPTVAMDVAARADFWAAMREYTTGGRTVIFATHYLAEAQEFADRVVLMRHGEVIADGSVAAICAKVDGRTIRANVPGAALAELRRLPGVGSAETRGERAELHCADSDAALRALLAAWPAAYDVSVTAMSLEDAFVVLTADDAGERV